MEIISRKEAIERGLKQYFTGESCTHGHVVERRVDNKRCTVCAALTHKKYYLKDAVKHRKVALQYREDHLEERKAYDKKYYTAHKGQKHEYNISLRRAKYRAEHRDELREKQRLYRKDHKEMLVQKRTKKLATNPVFKLGCTLRARLRLALRNEQKAGSAVHDLGCTTAELKTYLESKFQPGMTWDNWSRGGWHVDHIKPLSSFDLSDRQQFLEACHYTNLQPLWAEENLSKGAAYAI